MTTSSSPRPQIDHAPAVPDASHLFEYVCFQATRCGQASHAHVHEILSGLLSTVGPAKLFEPRYAAQADESGCLERLAEFFWLQLPRSPRDYTTSTCCTADITPRAFQFCYTPA